MAALAEDAKISGKKNSVKRVRATNFNQNEILKLEELVKDNLDTLNSKFTNQVTNNIKSEIWKDISWQVSALGYAHRTEQACSEKWANLKRKAKEEITKEKLERRKTGGGSMVVASDQSQRIGDLLAQTTAFSGIQGGLDTDEQDGLHYISNLERDEETGLDVNKIPITQPTDSDPSNVVIEKTTSCNSDQGGYNGPIAGCSKPNTSTTHNALKRPPQNRLALRKQAKRTKGEVLIDKQIAYFGGMVERQDLEKQYYRGLVERQDLEKELLQVKLRVMKAAESKMNELNACEMLKIITEQ